MTETNGGQTAPIGARIFHMIATVLRLSAVLTYLVITMAVLFVAALPIRLITPLIQSFKIARNLIPEDVISRYWTSGTLWFAGVSAEVTGSENVPMDSSAVILINHTSFIDPWASMGYCPIAPKFLYKRELFWELPPIGLLAYFMGHIPINRFDRNSAINSMNQLQSSIGHKKSVCIYPEGGRSTDGKLQPFKKGAFHIAHKSNVPIVIGLILGAYELWAMGTTFPYPGEIKIKWLKPIVFPAEMTLEEKMEKTYSIFSEELEKFRKEVGPIAPASTQKNPNTSRDLYDALKSLGFLSVVAAIAVSLVFGSTAILS